MRTQLHTDITTQPARRSAWAALTAGIRAASWLVALWGLASLLGTLPPALHVSVLTTVFAFAGIRLVARTIDLLGVLVRGFATALAWFSRKVRLPRLNRPAESPAGTGEANYFQRQRDLQVAEYVREGERERAKIEDDQSRWPLQSPRPAAEALDGHLVEIDFFGLAELPPILKSYLREQIEWVPPMATNDPRLERRADAYFVRNDGDRFDVRLAAA